MKVDLASPRKRPATPPDWEAADDAGVERWGTEAPGSCELAPCSAPSAVGESAPGARPTAWLADACPTARRARACPTLSAHA